MEDKERTIGDLMESLKELQNKVNGKQGGWEKKQTTTEGPSAVLVPISVETNDGTMSMYLQFSGSEAESPEKLFALIERLESQGYPLKTWKRKESWNRKKRWE